MSCCCSVHGYFRVPHPRARCPSLLVVIVVSLAYVIYNIKIGGWGCFLSLSSLALPGRSDRAACQRSHPRHEYTLACLAVCVCAGTSAIGDKARYVILRLRDVHVTVIIFFMDRIYV